MSQLIQPPTSLSIHSGVRFFMSAFKKRSIFAFDLIPSLIPFSLQFPLQETFCCPVQSLLLHYHELLTVLSDEYASTTNTSGLCRLFFAVLMTCSIVSSSFLVGNITTTLGIES
jgi:hypothetical protein